MTAPDPETIAETQRVGGRLHLVHKVKQEDGSYVTSVVGPLKVEFRLEDLGQLVAGASVMALPFSVTEEVWNLGSELSVGRTAAIAAVSLLTLAAFVWSLFYGERITQYPREYVTRVLSTYLITLCVSFLLLALFDKAPLDDLSLALTRTVIVALPASYSATAVDYIK
jgi:uncharacterized membrane protein